MPIRISPVPTGSHNPPEPFAVAFYTVDVFAAALTLADRAGLLSGDVEGGEAADAMGDEVEVS